MAKYRALVDVPPSTKAGDVVTINDPLIDEYKKKFALIEGDDGEPVEPKDDGSNTGTAGDNNNPQKTALVNPSREQMKARLTELGIQFAGNTPTVTLTEMLQSAEAKRLTGDGSEGGEKPEDKGDDEKQE